MTPTPVSEAREGAVQCRCGVWTMMFTAENRGIKPLPDIKPVRLHVDGTPVCPAPSATAEPLYPCDDCGRLRTKAEGGTTFTVCDKCWTKNYPKPAAPLPEPSAPQVEQTPPDADPSRPRFTQTDVDMLTALAKDVADFSDQDWMNDLRDRISRSLAPSTGTTPSVVTDEIELPSWCSACGGKDGAHTDNCGYVNPESTYTRSDLEAVAREAMWRGIAEQFHGYDRPKVGPAAAEVVTRYLASRPSTGTIDTEDTARLDWLESSVWITIEKTDESDNNGVGLVDSAVVLRSSNPDGQTFKAKVAATFREAIDASRRSPTGEAPEGGLSGNDSGK